MPNKEENLNKDIEEKADMNDDSNEYIENLEDDTVSENAEENFVAIIDALKKENEGLYKQFMLSEADLKNVKRRAEIDVANAHKFALEKFVKELVPVIDAMDLEIAAITDNSSAELQKFREGSILTYKMLLSGCEKFGIKQLNPIGEKLNPEYHQAITVQKSQEIKSNHIIQVVQNGYLLNDRLIRAAQVIVAE